MKKTLFLSVIAAITLLSCTTNESEIPDTQQAVLSVNARIMVETPATRAIIDGTVFPDGSVIGVQVRKTGEDRYQAGTSTNVGYTLNGSTWSTTTPFYLTNTLGEVYAYYPYASIGDNRTAFSTIPVTIDALAETGSETDYMYATPLTGDDRVSNATGENAADLVMNHAFAQVSFYVYKTNYSGTGTFTQFQIEDAAATSFVKTSSAALTMNITNGTLEGGVTETLTRTLESSVLLPAVLPATTISDLKDQVNATTLVVPTTDFGSGDIRFTFIIDGETYSAVNNTTVNSWLQGNQYIYTAKLEGTGLVIVDVTITDWTPIEGDLIDIK
jgi:hypothetical protein